MSEFTDVTVMKKANIYFEGKVSSRTIIFQDGSKKTLGILLPGEYEFGTSQREEMDIMSGTLEYKLNGMDWQKIEGSGIFFVPANERFQLKAHSIVDYCCSYFN